MASPRAAPRPRWSPARPGPAAPGRGGVPVCIASDAGGVEAHHRLAALAHGVLGELPREDEAHGRLDLARRQRVLLVQAAQVAGLLAEALEGVLHARLHDRHGLL